MCDVFLILWTMLRFAGRGFPGSRRGTLYFTFAPLSIVKNQEDYIVLLSRLAEGLSLSFITDFPTLGSRSLYPHCHTFAPKFFISPCGTITRFPPGPSSRATATYIKLLRSSWAVASGTFYVLFFFSSWSIRAHKSGSSRKTIRDMGRVIGWGNVAKRWGISHYGRFRCRADRAVERTRSSKRHRTALVLSLLTYT